VLVAVEEGKGVKDAVGSKFGAVEITGSGTLTAWQAELNKTNTRQARSRYL
jgi:hypothetical protein